jgi:hypothetical protein
MSAPTATSWRRDQQRQDYDALAALDRSEQWGELTRLGLNAFRAALDYANAWWRIALPMVAPPMNGEFRNTKNQDRDRRDDYVESGDGGQQ